jgi:hypothetical protein
MPLRHSIRRLPAWPGTAKPFTVAIWFGATTPQNQSNKDTKMSIKTTIALAAAFALGATVTTSAATKHEKIAKRRNSPQFHAAVPRGPAYSDPNSPEATGGGSLGYNQNIYSDW